MIDNLDKTAVWRKTHPIIDDEGIWIPLNDFVCEGTDTRYKLVITKDIFVEAYNRWIKENNNG